MHPTANSGLSSARLLAGGAVCAAGDARRWADLKERFNYRSLGSSPVCLATRASTFGPPSAALEGQPERDHLLAVANQQYIAGQHRVVPCLALDRRESHEFRESSHASTEKRECSGSSAPRA